MLNTKIFLSFFLFSIFTCELYTQATSLNFANNIQLRDLTISRKSNNLKDFPFRFGAEFLNTIAFNAEQKYLPGFLVFFDVNLSKNLVFLKFEYGNIYDNKNENTVKLASVGLNYNILNGRRDNLYLHGAAIAFWSNSNEGGIGGGISGFLSLRYMRSIGDYVGIVSSIRYPFASFSTLVITTGIQIFIK